VAAPPAAQRSPAAGRAPPEEERPAPSEDPGGGPRPRRGGELAELSAVLASDQGFVSALSTSLKGELRDWLDDQFETHWARWQEEGRLAVPVSGVLAEKAADWPLAQRTSLLDRGGRAGAREDGLAGVEAYVAKKVAEERAGVSEAGVPAPGGAASWPAARAPRQAAAGQGPTPPGSAPDPLAAQAVASTRTAPEGSSAPSPSEQGPARQPLLLPSARLILERSGLEALRACDRLSLADPATGTRLPVTGLGVSYDTQRRRRLPVILPRRQDGSLEALAF
ncbi:unnamed protein product, partial [Prorocentrum cordatum]